MTREEANEILENWNLCHYTPSREAAEAVISVLDPLEIISALRLVSREQLERVCGAEWIKKYRHRGGFRRYTGTDDMGEVHTITVDERAEYDDLYCSKCGKQSADNFLNFCPNCGRTMTPEAWEELRKRWEALYGDR